MDKQQVWDAIATPNNWNPNGGDKKIFFGKRLQIEAAQLCDLKGVNIPALINELRDRPRLTATLGRWTVTLRSPRANDIHEQDEYPNWINAAVEDCSRHKAKNIHTATWCLT